MVILLSFFWVEVSGNVKDIDGTVWLLELPFCKPKVQVTSSLKEGQKKKSSSKNINRIETEMNCRMDKAYSCTIKADFYPNIGSKMEATVKTCENCTIKKNIGPPVVYYLLGPQAGPKSTKWHEVQNVGQVCAEIWPATFTFFKRTL